jgi:hypothetical protein
VYIWFCRWQTVEVPRSTGLFRCTINCGSYQIFVLCSVQLVGSKVNVQNGKPKLTSWTRTERFRERGIRTGWTAAGSHI